MIKALLVDDDEQILELSKLFLDRLEDMDVRTVSSVYDAEALMREEPFDVIISDLSMPDRDGISFLKDVRALDPDIPFIILTGKSSEMAAIDAINNGAHLYLLKGSDPENMFAQLAEMVRNAVGEQRRMRTAHRSMYLDMFFAVSNDLLCILDLDGNFIRVNKSWQKLLGYDVEGLKGKWFLDMVHPADLSPTYAAITDLQKGRKMSVFTNQFIAANKEYHPVDWQAVRYDANSIYVVGRDSMEQRRVEDALHQAKRSINVLQRDLDGQEEAMVLKQEELRRAKATVKEKDETLWRSRQVLNTILDMFPGVIYWKDRDSVYLGANRTTAMIIGVADPAEIVGKNDFDMPWAKTEAEAYRAADREVMDSGKPKAHIVERQLRIGGNVAWLDTSKAPMRDPEGKVYGILGISVDVTELMESRDELLHMKVLMRSSPAILIRWRLTDGFPVDFVSKNVTRFGYNATDIINGTIRLGQIMHPDDIERVSNEIKAMTGSGRNEYDLSYRMLAKDGTVLWVEDHTLVERDPMGKVAHLQSIIVDITDQKTVEDALIRKTDELTAVQLALRELEEKVRNGPGQKAP